VYSFVLFWGVLPLPRPFESSGEAYSISAYEKVQCAAMF